MTRDCLIRGRDLTFYRGFASDGFCHFTSGSPRNIISIDGPLVFDSCLQFCCAWLFFTDQDRIILESQSSFMDRGKKRMERTVKKEDRSFALRKKDLVSLCVVWRVRA